MNEKHLREEESSCRRFFVFEKKEQRRQTAMFLSGTSDVQARARDHGTAA